MPNGSPSIDTAVTAIPVVPDAMSPAAGLPLLTTGPASGTAGRFISVPITVAVSAADPTETVTIVIAGVPDSARLSAGTKNADGTWTLSIEETIGLTLMTSALPQTASLTVTATATDNGDPTTASSVAKTIALTADLTAPTPAATSTELSLEATSFSPASARVVALGSKFAELFIDTQQQPVDWLRIFDPATGTHSPLIVVTDTDANSYTTNGDAVSQMQAVALTDGRLLVIWVDNTGGINGSFYTSSGSVSAANLTLISPVAGLGLYDARVAAMANGGFALLYVANDGSAAGALTLATFDSTGKLLTSNALAAPASANSTQGLAITALADGTLAGIVVYTQDAGNAPANAVVAPDLIGILRGTAVTPFRPLYAGSVIGPQIVALSNGGFAFLVEYNAGSNLRTIVGATFDPMGTEHDFAIQTEIGTSTAPIAALTALPSGGFLVTYDQALLSTGGDLRYAQQFNALGQTLGGPIQIASGVGDSSLSALSNGSVVSASVTAANGDVRALTLTPLPASTAPTPAATDAGWPIELSPQSGVFSVAALSTGGFVEGYTGVGTMSFRLFDSNGIQIGGPTTASDNGTIVAGDPAVTALTGGRFLMAWQVYNGSGAEYDGAIYDSTGKLLVAPFRLTPAVRPSPESAGALRVAALPNGGFTTTWQSSVDIDIYGTTYLSTPWWYSQTFSASGTAMGAPAGVGGYYTHELAIGNSANGPVIASIEGSATDANDDQIMDLAVNGQTLIASDINSAYLESLGITELDGGGYVVSYYKQIAGASRTIDGFVFNASGAIAAQFSVPTNYNSEGGETSFGFPPSVIALTGGGFAVTVNNLSPTARNVYNEVQLFDQNGKPVNGQQIVLPGGYYSQGVSLGNGNFLYASNSNGSVIGQVVTPLAGLQGLAWTGAMGTDLGTAGNWSPARMPNAADTLSFALSCGTLTGMATGLSATFASGTTWNLDNATLTLAGNPSVASGPLGVSDQGSVVLNASAIAASGAIDIEASAAGGAGLTASGASSLSDTVTTIGGQQGNAGTLTLAGMGTALTGTGAATIGGGGTGHLVVQSGATASVAGGLSLGVSAGGSGSVDVAGSGGRLSVGASLIDGGAGIGGLTIEQLGTVQAAGFDAGQMAGGSGSVLVTGPNALLTNTGGFVVGDSGLADLTIANRGTVITTSVMAPVAAPMNSTANSTRTGGTGVNAANVANTGTLFASSGTYEVTGAVTGAGLLEVDAGGVLRLDGAVAAGQTVAFTDSTGTLTIGDPAGFAATRVTGFTAGDKIALPTSAYIEPSYNPATGQLQLQDNNGDTLAALTFANKPASAAVLSSLVLPVGAVIANQTGSDGSGVTVAGSGASWTIGGELDVGNAAAGGLTITGGATVTASQAQVGLAAGGSGNVNLEGAGSNLSIANDLTIGATVPGVLTLGSGAKLTVVNNLVVGKFGVINQFGGVIDPSRFPNSGVVGPTGTTIANLEVENAGTFFAQSGTYTINSAIIDLGTLTGAGTLQIKDGGDLVLNAAVDASQTVQFSTSTGTLEVGFVNGVNTNPAIGSFAPKIIKGFAAGDTIQVDTATPATVSVTGTTAAIISNGTTLGVLTFDQAPAGTIVACFAAGTRIATPEGQTAVETLREGDLVTTLLGGSGRVVWVGSRTVDCARHPRPEQVWPVRIERHAFGRGMPARTLFVSPDHALYVDGVLIPAKLLIDGMAVRQVKRKSVTYHHIELQQHDVVLADGMPAESYLDTGDRSKFAGGSVIALHPDFTARVWAMEGCAELVSTGPVLDAVRRRLAAGQPKVSIRTPRQIMPMPVSFGTPRGSANT